MAELPSLAPQGGAGLSAPEAGSAVPFTDAQVDEFREQDRWLPVSVCKTAERRDRLESLCFSEVRVSGQGNFQSASCIPREQLGLPIVLGSQVVLCQDESETTSTTPLATTMDGQPRIANVSRIMKNSLPTTAKVSKEAKENATGEGPREMVTAVKHIAAVQPPPTLSVAVSHPLKPLAHRFSATSEAAEKCLNEKRKTINGEDILTSMRALGFDNYEGVLKVYLAKYREHQIHQARQRQNQPQQLDDDSVDLKRGAEDDDGEARRKKARPAKRRDE
ncbi:uncharacterized protein EHS24_003251 [Apiotrichum porosum]|uniref:Transcription factor CBF/NF-Y/archaeal histone domain-containing protein n=1 Tax=Apiotrichum porosum TaxID=105984 RepID=A0A427XFM2_9TREE|nr:uncharacterized protein EHS24_003251 [Apiotrichum porosum]RSH77685.1 hypothetical protein EHS24_003251 [Apiotrichum porosum]